MRRRLRLLVPLLVVACVTLPGALPGAPSARASAPLAGKIIGIDPGHNGRNWADPSYINHRVWNGREWENCDTTGTETASRYTESSFNLSVAKYLASYLQAEGAKVVWTRTTNSGVGPCVDRRAKMLNGGHANVSIDIHADGGPTGGRGFAILEPVADGPNNKVMVIGAVRLLRPIVVLAHYRNADEHLRRSQRHCPPL